MTGTDIKILEFNKNDRKQMRVFALTIDKVCQVMDALYSSSIEFQNLQLLFAENMHESGSACQVIRVNR